MFAAICLLLASQFCENPSLSLQICLDRAGYSCNTIDGRWGEKSERALQRYFSDRFPGKSTAALTHEQICDRFFAGADGLFRIETVTQADLDALTAIPEESAGKAALAHMGYESIKEMFAERGHLSQIALERINPGVDWANIRPGLKLVIPDFPLIAEELAAGERGRPNRPRRPDAAMVKISVSKGEISVFDKNGRRISLFPCSVAQNKAKIPPHGELKITSYVEHPNYTYTPDYTPSGSKVRRYIFPAGPNNPVGVAWMGLNLPGYGIHGTPRPESIGFTGSHGCFRLANWNAARLYAMCRPGVKVIVEP